MIKFDHSSLNFSEIANEKGHGLGLKLCGEFIEKNNGKIWIESEENLGTKVRISLPKANL